MALMRIRDKAQSWVSWVIVLAIAVMFALWGVSYYIDAAATSSESVAKVNGEPISTEMLNQAYRRTRETLLREGQSNVNASALRQQVLKRLIEQMVLAQAADNIGLVASIDQVDAAIYNDPVFQQDGKFSMARYQLILQRIGLTNVALRRELEQTMLINQLRIGIMGSQFTLPNELQSFIAGSLEKRRFRYLMFDRNHFQKQVMVTKTDIQNYYHAHQADFYTKLRLKLAYILVSQKTLLAKIQVSDADAENYYQQHLTSFMSPERRRAAQIIIHLPKSPTSKQLNAAEQKAQMIERELVKGKSFASLAKQYSDDPISAQKGGDIGWIKPGQFAGTFEKTLFHLQKTGDVSEPIRTQFGLQIIKLTGIEPPKQKPFSEVKAEIITTLKRQKAEQEYSDLGNNLGNITFENPSSLSYAAESLHLPVETTAWFDKDHPQGIATHPKVLKAALSDNVLKEGNNSDVINISPTEVVVVRIDKQIPARLKPLSEVEGEIRTLLMHQKEMAMAIDSANALLVKLHQGQNPATLAKSHDLHWQSGGVIQRSNKTESPALVQAVFRLPKPAKKPVFGLAKIGNDAVAIVEVEAVIPGKASAKERVKYQQALMILLAGSDYQNYIDALKAKARIKIQSS